jgi:hypothetical protein
LACSAAGTCDQATGACVYAPLPDGTACDDQNACTAGEACTQGTCGGGTTPGIVTSDGKTTFTCPPTAIADDGIVRPACAFPNSFAPNNVFSGDVSLISHLDRDFAGFDVFTLPNGDVQLMCVYKNADDLQIGGFFTIVTFAGGCVPTADGFVCTP